MRTSADYMNLPFDEAIEFFRGKVNLPTKAWDDLLKDQHAGAFVVAGATKLALIGDLRSAVDKAISSGTTLAEFRQDFDKIVERHGWKYKGGRGWRTATIFNTNLATAYAAGHYQQQMRPAVSKVRPFLRYVPSSSIVPRVAHKQWYNLVLPNDDPFWQTHYPPNGWNCKCGVVSASAREVERLIKEEKDGPFPIQTKAPKIETYDWTDKRTGEVLKVPRGIDPSWDYNPGQAGQRLRKLSPRQSTSNYAVVADVVTKSKTPILELPAKNFSEALTLPGRKESGWSAEEYINKFLAEFGASIGAPAVHYDVLGEAMVISEELFRNRVTGGFKVFKSRREKYLPMLADALKDPVEIWLTELESGGRKRICKRYIGIYKGVGQSVNGFAVFDLIEDEWQGTTIFKPGTLAYLDKQRRGALIYAKK